MERIEAAIQAQLSKGAEAMDNALQLSTGLTLEQRKTVVYWTMATHMLPHIDLFPLLVLRGDPGSGKSTTLRIIAKFAYKAELVTVRHSSYAVLRDMFARLYQGTAVIEEGDKSRQGVSVLEGFYSDRYQRNSSNVGVKESTGRDTWAEQDKKLFGAIAMHRRLPFTDAALDGRSIVVNYSLVDGDYSDCSDSDWIREISATITDTTIPQINILRKPKGVLDRIFDTYRPILTYAAICGDDDFCSDIQEQLEIDTAALRESHSLEPDGLMVRAMIALSGEQESCNTVKVGAIIKWVWEIYRQQLGHREVATMARMMGFKTKESGGVTVILKAPAALLKACTRCGYSGEDVDNLKHRVMGSDFVNRQPQGKWWIT